MTLPSTSMVGVKATSPAYSSGTMVAGVINTDFDSPLEVTSHQLVFNINDVPPTTNFDPESYDSHLSATYAIYNPTSNAVDARLMFPLGSQPSYWMQADYQTILDRYEVKTDDVVTPKELRHTYKRYSPTSNINTDVTKLADTKVTDFYFNDELPIYRYAVTINPQAAMTASAISLVISQDFSGYILAEGYNWSKEVANNYHIQLSAKKNQLFHLYFIGVEYPTLATSFKLYDTFSDENEFAYTATVVKDEISLNDLVNLEYDQDLLVSEIDYYNAMIDFLNYRFRGENAIFFASTYLLDIYPYLQAWYDYDVTVLAGQTVINQVTSPLFPMIQESFTPPMYQYDYLMSPNLTWASFSNITIDIKTELFLLDPSLTGFVKEADGYHLELATLPEEDFYFNLCESENPKAHNFALDTLMMVLATLVALGGMIIVPLIIALVIAGIIILIIHNVSKRKKQP